MKSVTRSPWIQAAINEGKRNDDFVHASGYSLIYVTIRWTFLQTARNYKKFYFDAIEMAKASENPEFVWKIVTSRGGEMLFGDAPNEIFDKA